jgi:murein DD-endopeptidase MepM/ murein hydrolase activator NlpD
MEVLSYHQTTRDWRTHNGVDIAAEEGTEVMAAADGEVYTVYQDESLGHTVVIRHEGGYTTRYASLDEEVAVAAGDQVQAGQTIGKVGNTALLECGIGDHLHFAVSCGESVVDPADFLS